MFWDCNGPTLENFCKQDTVVTQYCILHGNIEMKAENDDSTPAPQKTCFFVQEGF